MKEAATVICEVCNKEKPSDEVKERHVAKKGAILNCCATCDAKEVTYDPGEWLSGMGGDVDVVTA